MLKAYFYNRTTYCGDGCCAVPDGVDISIECDGEVIFEKEEQYGRVYDTDDAIQLLEGYGYTVAPGDIDIQP